MKWIEITYLFGRVEVMPFAAYVALPDEVLRWTRARLLSRRAVIARSARP